MRNRRAYLLFELLCATMILCTTAVAISRAFSKQMELSGIAFQQASLNPFIREKIFEIEKQLKEKPESLEEMKTLSGAVLDTGLTWNMTLKPSEKYPSLLKAHFTISGLKNEREVSLNLFMKAPEMKESGSIGGEPSEGEDL